MSNYFILAKCEVEGNEINVAVLHDYRDYNDNRTAICYGNNKLFLAFIVEDKMSNIISLKFIDYITTSDCSIYDADEEFKRVFALEELEGNADD